MTSKGVSRVGAKCRVQTLANEFTALVKSRADADAEKVSPATGALRRLALGRQITAVEDRIDVLMADAASTQAHSTGGALFQLGVAHDAANDLASKFADDPVAAAVLRGLTRTIYSAAYALERAARGGKSEGLRLLMPPEQNPLIALAASFGGQQPGGPRARRVRPQRIVGTNLSLVPSQPAKNTG